MAIALEIAVFPAALWPQGDIRDPLGTWGFREGVTGDASGGSIKLTAIAPAGLAAAYVYTCYSLNWSQLTGTLTNGVLVKARLLTNWPNIDTDPGVQGYGSMIVDESLGDTDFTAPIAGVDSQLVSPNERFLLLFDPRPSAGSLSIVEMEYGANTDLATYSFEGYGYFWDRSVLNAPGGPRHPGSS